MFFSNKNILVTGGTGFVGSHLVEELLRQKANVVTTHRSVNPLSYFFEQSLDKRSIMMNIDVCNYDALFDIVTRYNIEYIFHLAAQPLVEVAYYNPKQTLYSNILGTVNILECSRLYPKIKAVIVASSDKAYGKTTKKKYIESDPLKGDHPYEVSKSSADLITQSYYTTYRLPVVTTRFGNIYGEGDLNYSRLIPGIMQSLIKNETLQIRSDGTYTRDYLYVKDVVDGYLLLAENISSVQGDVFNFGSNDTYTVKDVVDKIGQVLNQKISYNVVNNAVNEIPYQSLDYSKINKKLQWAPKYNLETVIKEIYKWYKKVV